MGYRSEVALVLDKNDYLAGLSWMKRNDINEEENLLLPHCADKVIERDDRIIIYYSSIKWYKTFHWFDSLIYLYTFLDGIGRDRYSILRVGEESDDIEYEGNTEELYSAEVYPVTTIEMNEWSNDVQVDDERLATLLNEDKCYRIHLKLGKPSREKRSWLT